MTSAPNVLARRPRARRRGLMAAALAAVLALAISACSVESNAALDMINGSRWQAGRAPVELQIDLWFKAQGWSDRLANDGYLHHSYLPDGMGGVPWQKLGENVAVAWSLQGAHNAFMSSTFHRNNILDPAFTHAAVGVTVDIYGRYWVVQEFMRM